MSTPDCTPWGATASEGRTHWCMPKRQPPISGSPAASMPTRDDLDRPVTQRQLLEVLAYLSANGDRYAYDTFAVQWRQEARAEALTQVDDHTEQGTA